ncbi:YdcF family protein [Pedobacter sp. HMWF019]|uniref:YdcF family protein n=1 Tax=Pedobacter sp. HMWF019 TaxID=2056856 RepID=UPI000D3A0249|nr:YdcF family protein [Pedobacter sp. HMWF019]PTS94113.1 YdcF family protein [Pedobacter sp. HMWF019]
MKILSFLICCGFLSLHALAQKAGPDKAYALQSTHNPVQYKNYYLFTLLQKDQTVKKMILDDQVLSTLLKDKLVNINNALKSCPGDISCFTSAVKFSDDEIRVVGERLNNLFKTGNPLDLLVKNQLLPSGCYSMYEELKSKELLIKAWEQDAKAVNYAIEVYVEGRKPNYPAIDSIGFNVKDKSYSELVKTNALLSLRTKNNLFFEPAMQFALVALEINERNDAADYEPMTGTVNKEALLSVQKTDFSHYKYSLILVPGEGPEERDTELSAGGMLRCRLAAEQYQKGVAPFIMVSGGRVHPYKTKYSEAYEMKKFLRNTLQIPEEAILMEPHARHTTTNMRNASRIMFRYGIPMNKVALVVTVKSQSMYISGVMPQRCIQELGYVPYRIGKRLSDQELEFYPNTMSLQIDFDEPLDP